MPLSASTVTINVKPNTGSLVVRNNNTTILRTKKKIRFYCRHCGAIFITTNWFKTKRGHRANCPCCPYAAWTK